MDGRRKTTQGKARHKARQGKARQGKGKGKVQDTRRRRQDTKTRYTIQRWERTSSFLSNTIEFNNRLAWQKAWTHEKHKNDVSSLDTYKIKKETKTTAGLERDVDT
jgi:hypothetical protein